MYVYQCTCMVKVVAHQLPFQRIYHVLCDSGVKAAMKSIEGFLQGAGFEDEEGTLESYQVIGLTEVCALTVMHVPAVLEALQAMGVVVEVTGLNT